MAFPRPTFKGPCTKCGNTTNKYNPLWLRAVRKKAKLSLTAVADKLGYTKGYLSDIELGKRECSQTIKGCYLKLYEEFKDKT